MRVNDQSLQYLTSAGPKRYVGHAHRQKCRSILPIDHNRYLLEQNDRKSYIEQKYSKSYNIIRIETLSALLYFHFQTLD